MRDYVEGPLRTEWIIRVPAPRVLAACLDKIVWHEERHTYWNTERTRLIQDAPNRIQVDPSEVEKLLSTSNVSSYGGAGPRLDPEYARELSQADTKVKEHAGHIRELIKWRVTLEMMPENELLELKHDDRVYFYLKKDA